MNETHHGGIGSQRSGAIYRPGELALPQQPAFSVIITTDRRVAALRDTLNSLRYLDYPKFEVCVVHGPTEDGTQELLHSWEGQIKIAACPLRNLTMARNIGIALAAGDVLAFLDDDAVPEPEWLTDLAAAYDAPTVGGAGGFVYDEGGACYQTRYVTLDRLGLSYARERAMPEFNFPLSSENPHLLGTNCSFRRDALVAIGGFDEQIGRFLDESDVCCRMVDQGWALKQVAGAYVHHKLLTDDLRTKNRVIRGWYPLFKNKLYYPLVNGRRHHTIDQIVAHAREFVRNFAEQTDRAIENGILREEDRERFREEAARAWRDGLSQGMAGDRRFISSDTLRRYAQPFLPFPATLPAGGRKEPSSPTIAHRASSTEDEPLKSSPGSVASSTREAAVGRVARVTLVSPIIAGHDAVSAAVPHTIEVLRGNAQFELSVLTAFNDFPGMSAYIVNGLGALLLHPAFITADLLIYHFGIYHPFFDALIAAEGRARQIVAFHAPVKLAGPEQEPVVEASFRQLFNLRHADRIWCMSEVNAAELAARGFDPHQIDMIPLAVERPPYARLAAKKNPQVELLFVGRIARSKGVLDLIEAVDLARGACEVPFRLRIAGSLEFSDAAYVTRVHQEIAERRLSCVQFLGTVEDEALFALYHMAHVLAIPSYHEGFGVPVIEALRSGCIPVGYAAHDLPNAAARLGRMVPTGDREQLAMALTQVIAGVARSADRPDEALLPLDCGMVSRYAFDQAAHAHAAQFGAKRIGNEMLRSISGVLDAPAPPRWTERFASNLVGGNVQS